MTTGHSSVAQFAEIDRNLKNGLRGKNPYVLRLCHHNLRLNYSRPSSASNDRHKFRDRTPLHPEFGKGEAVVSDLKAYLRQPVS